MTALLRSRSGAVNDLRRRAGRDAGAKPANADPGLVTRRAAWLVAAVGWSSLGIGLSAVAGTAAPRDGGDRRARPRDRVRLRPAAEGDRVVVAAVRARVALLPVYAWVGGAGGAPGAFLVARAGGRRGWRGPRDRQRPRRPRAGRGPGASPRSRRGSGPSGSGSSRSGCSSPWGSWRSCRRRSPGRRRASSRSSAAAACAGPRGDSRARGHLAGRAGAGLGVPRRRSAWPRWASPGCGLQCA